MPMAFLAAAFAALHVAFFAPPGGHAPRVGVEWHYTLRAWVTPSKPAHARLTAQIVDPLGGAHLVQFGKTNRYIRNFPFVGVFRDFVIWPKDSRGIPLTLRLTVVSGKAKRIVTYAVTPRA